jgi:hypothetical protein
MQSMAVFSRSEIITLYPSTSTGSNPKNFLTAGSTMRTCDSPTSQRSQPHRCHKEDHVAVLRRQPVMGGRGAEADVIGIGDAAGERQHIAVAQDGRAWRRSGACHAAPAFRNPSRA